jgi:hypothetical protein
MMVAELIPPTGAKPMYGLGPIEAIIICVTLVFWGVIFAAAVKILRSSRL